MKLKKYKVLWIINAIRIGKRGKRTVSLGFCEKTKQVAFISVGDLNKPATMETLKPFIINDVCTDESGCDDAKWCWNLECPFNKSTPETLRRYVGKKCDDKTFKLASDRLQEWGSHFIKEIDWNETSHTVFKKPPLVISQKKMK